MSDGVNRANWDKKELLESEGLQEAGNCVFISHKYEDLDAAKKIAEFIMKSGTDVYLDDNDNELQKAVVDNNPQKIVECIEDALMLSTHILILVTENTRKSWWVPYETGYAKNGRKDIASLLLKDVEEFPDYLKIERTLKGYDDLKEYIEHIRSNYICFESGQDFAATYKDELLRYINE